MIILLFILFFLIFFTDLQYLSIYFLVKSVVGYNIKYLSLSRSRFLYLSRFF